MKRVHALTVVFILSAGLCTVYGGECAYSADRLAEFSDMVRDLDAGADAPVTERTEPARSDTAGTAAVSSVTAPIQSVKVPAQSVTLPVTSVKAPVQKVLSSRRLTITAGAAKRMETTYTPKANEIKTKAASDDGSRAAVSAAEDTVSKAVQDVSGNATDNVTGNVSGNASGRLSDFAALVKDAEAEAGITDSDPESEPVVPADLSDEELLGQEDALSGGGSRLEEFAALADAQGGGAADVRLMEMAALTGEDSSEYVDDRIVALSRVSEEQEDEMEEKYGSRIEDTIVKSPSDYDDGDRVVTTANTKEESAARYASSHNTGSAYTWRKGTDEKAQKAERLFGSLIDRIKDDSGSVNDISGGSSGQGADSDEWSYMSGFFTELKDSIEGFEHSDTDKLSLGTFTLTAYDACIQCCGKTDGITATRTRAQTGRTIAVDPNIIPYGSKVMINGHVYTAEDTGSAIKGKKIDIFMGTHEEATIFGLRHAEVFLVK